MNTESSTDCTSDGTSSTSRRTFLRTSTGAAAGIGAAGFVPALAAKKKEAKGTPETLVKTFYDTLNEEQHKMICFPFEHKLRLKVDNNWQITKAKVESFTKDQQAMIKDIFMGIHSEEYAEKVFDQVEWDSGIDGFEGGSSVAVFGKPGTDKFEFVLTGRHCTRFSAISTSWREDASRRPSTRRYAAAERITCSAGTSTTTGPEPSLAAS